jgi:hypothetical protein
MNERYEPRRREVFYPLSVAAKLADRNREVLRLWLRDGSLKGVIGTYGGMPLFLISQQQIDELASRRTAKGAGRRTERKHESD